MAGDGYSRTNGGRIVRNSRDRWLISGPGVPSSFLKARAITRPLFSPESRRRSLMFQLRRCGRSAHMRLKFSCRHAVTADRSSHSHLTACSSGSPPVSRRLRRRLQHVHKPSNSRGARLQRSDERRNRAPQRKCNCSILLPPY